MMSKPAVQKATAGVRQRTHRSSEPGIGIQAAAGAMASANPKTRCEKEVNRLVKEYEKITPSATGARRKHKAFNSRAAKMKISEETITKPQAKPAESNPAGIWRSFVRGLRASISASIRRLNAMAAERAPTIATTIQASFRHRRSLARPPSRTASRAPVKAKGSAEIECSNLIISSVKRMRFQSIAAAFSGQISTLSFQRSAEPLCSG